MVNSLSKEASWSFLEFIITQILLYTNLRNSPSKLDFNRKNNIEIFQKKKHYPKINSVLLSIKKSYYVFLAEVFLPAPPFLDDETLGAKFFGAAFFGATLIGESSPLDNSVDSDSTGFEKSILPFS